MALTAAELEALAKKPAQVAIDAASTAARPADDVIKLDDRAAAVGAAEGGNGYGGPKSAFRMLRPGGAIMPGGK